MKLKIYRYKSLRSDILAISNTSIDRFDVIFDGHETRRLNYDDIVGDFTATVRIGIITNLGHAAAIRYKIK